MVWWLNPVSLVFVIGSACGACTAFIALLCSNMRMSRCKKISICCGCFACDRENLSETEFASELDNQHQIEGSINQPSNPQPPKEGGSSSFSSSQV